MDISIENKRGLNAQLHVKVKTDDYAEDVRKSLLTYQKKMNVPGFRAGKVPMGVVQRMIGGDVKKEQVDKKLQKGISDYLKENNISLVLSPLSTYMSEEVDWKAPEMEFSYDIGLRPEIQPEIKALDALTRSRIVLSDDEVEKEIENLRKQAGQMDMTEEVVDDDSLSIALKFTELDADGMPLDGGQQKSKFYQAGQFPAKLKNILLGARVGDKVKVDLSSHFSEEEIEEMLEVDKMTARDLNKEFEIEVRTAFKINPAETNQEFFDRYTTPGKVSNMEDFKGEWKSIVENYYQREADSLFFKEVRKALLENTKFDMPEEFLKKYYTYTSDSNAEGDKEDIDAKYPKFEEELKWMLISDTIAEKNDLKVNEDEVLNYAMGLINYEFNRSGVRDMDEKQVRQYAINYLQEESNYSRIVVMLRDNKVFDHLLSIISPKEEALSVDTLKEKQK